MEELLQARDGTSFLCPVPGQAAHHCMGREGRSELGSILEAR